MGLTNANDYEMGPLWWDGYRAAEQDALTLICALLMTTGPVEIPDSDLVAADTDEFIMEKSPLNQYTRLRLKRNER